MENEIKDPEKHVIGVRFTPAAKPTFYITEITNLRCHEFVVVEGEKGTIVGQTLCMPYVLPEAQIPANMKKVVRRAEPEDVTKYYNDRDRGQDAFVACEKKISEHKLPMKLIDVYYSSASGKVTFYFSAEQRIDFRALVKDLAKILHMRIEMRQIGARDASKVIGALGPCGLNCCCSNHLSSFESISIQMAKNQGLSPNPTKLTGLCGKLKCCLNYENATYCEERSKLPPIGTFVEITEGKGVIVDLDILRHQCSVRLEPKGDKDSEMVKVDVGALKSIVDKKGRTIELPKRTEEEIKELESLNDKEEKFDIYEETPE